MGKMLSILEKYHLVEKDTAPNEVVANDDITTLEETNNSLAELSDTPIENETVSEKDETTSDLPTTSITKEEAPVEVESTKQIYNTSVTIDDVYAHFGLSGVAPTQTVFLLENLLKALPTELPDFVKKTTLDNIAAASAIDVTALLKDGEARTTQLNTFINDFTNSNQEDISNLKQEIDKLSAIIANYQQQIKSKELLIQEETALIENEVHRIHTILDFFQK